MRPYGAHCPCRRCCTPDRLLIPTSSAPCAGSRPAATRLPTGSCAPASWSEAGDGERASQIAAGLGCHPKTVRQWLHRFNTHGVDGLGDRPRSGRPRRLDQTQRGQLVALVGQDPTGRLVRQADGTLAAVDPQQPGVWTLDALVQAAHELGIAIERSQVRRILLEEGARWRHPRSWTASPDPEFVPKGPESSTSIPTRRPG
jgi:transposase